MTPLVACCGAAASARGVGVGPPRIEPKMTPLVACCGAAASARGVGWGPTPLIEDGQLDLLAWGPTPTPRARGAAPQLAPRGIYLVICVTIPMR